MSVVAPTREQILMLYRAHLATARSFASYNFREYFVRRTRDQFRAFLYPETSDEAHREWIVRSSDDLGREAAS